MKIKKGDSVIVITGKDKGATGTVIRALPKEDKVIVEGVNMRKKHQRAKRDAQKGQIVEKPMPIHVSNVMRADKKTTKAPKKAAKKETK
jgi:large subunit ribosomal protein L24